MHLVTGLGSHLRYMFAGFARDNMAKFGQADYRYMQKFAQ